jgi:ribosomal-protein-alanine N-acetyltransferase
MKGSVPSPCRLRPTRPGDASAVAAIHCALFERPWQRDCLQRLLELPTVRAFIAEATTAQALVGFILGQVAADDAEILSIGVAPAWQRCGIAGLLIRAFTASVSGAGAKRVLLEVAADNKPALALYLRHGFHCVGRRKCYYEHRGAPFADALVLAKGS